MKHEKKRRKTKVSFKPKNYVSTNRPSELLHMDLFIPSRTISHSGNFYELVIVNDFSMYIWTLVLESKS